MFDHPDNNPKDMCQCFKKSHIICVDQNLNAVFLLRDHTVPVDRYKIIKQYF